MERPADFTIFRISDFTRQEYSWCFFSDFLCFERKGENTLDKTARSARCSCFLYQLIEIVPCLLGIPVDLLLQLLHAVEFLLRAQEVQEQKPHLLAVEG